MSANMGGNMIKRVSEMMIKEILRHKDQKIDTIHRKMLNLYEELDSNDSVPAALPSIKSDGMPSGKGGHTDLGDVLISMQKQRYEHWEEVRRMMWELSEQENMINRVWACFNALEDPFYSILCQIYVNNQKYQSVEDEYDISHKTFEKKRQEGVYQIMRYYESSSSVSELMREHVNSTDQDKGRKIRSQKKDSDYSQICLPYLHTEET